MCSDCTLQSYACIQPSRPSIETETLINVSVYGQAGIRDRRRRRQTSLNIKTGHRYYLSRASAQGLHLCPDRYLEAREIGRQHENEPADDHNPERIRFENWTTHKLHDNPANTNKNCNVPGNLFRCIKSHLHSPSYELAIDILYPLGPSGGALPRRVISNNIHILQTIDFSCNLAQI